ncbi:MAG: AAA family ATPase [Candidatus Thermoplasmatota archaeon]
MEVSPLLMDHVRSRVSLAPTMLGNYTLDAGGNRIYWRWAYYRFRTLLDGYLSGRSEDRWVVFSGLRGTGKTTLLAQLYFHLAQQGVPQQNILYVSMDQVTRLIGADLNGVVRAYESLMNTSLEDLSGNHFLLVDEAHYDRNWAVAQKAVFDRTRRVFMITTGSSALSLQSSSDAARRARKERLYPLNFPEYMTLKHKVTQTRNLKERIEGAIFRSKDAIEAYESLRGMKGEVDRYWSSIKPYEVETFLTVGTLPFAIPFSEEEDVFGRVLDSLSKIVNSDIPAIQNFDKETLDKIFNILLLFAVNGKCSYESLSQKVKISRSALSEVLDVLIKSEVIYPIRPYGSVSSGISKSPKYKFNAPVVKAALLHLVGKFAHTPEVHGRLLEEAVSASLFRLRGTENWLDFFHDAREGGADFIVRLSSGEEIVIEVGYGTKGKGQIIRTAKKVRPKYGVLISENELSVFPEDNIVSIPKEYMLSI